MKNIPTEGRISIGRQAVPVMIGTALILIGLAGFLSMDSGVLAGSLRNADMMSVGLGVQFFAGLALIAYGVLIGGRRYK